MAAGDDSAIEWTQAEVERIVQMAMDHARMSPELSLGVLALTAGLASEVESTLRNQLQALAAHDRTDPALAFFEEDRAEPFVVSDLDSAYVGRDVVMLGVGLRTHPARAGTAPLPVTCRRRVPSTGWPAPLASARQGAVRGRRPWLRRTWTRTDSRPPGPVRCASCSRALRGTAADGRAGRALA